ncbi:MAG: DUF2256 domain-containing protein [Myxococcota bacterium]|nr:DUF2256 domain-containing protein [Myxococcota bacterium]
MARQKRKYLPSKTCEACQRPFEWRKKWANCWDEVKYCSKACRDGRYVKAKQKLNRK